MLPLVTLISFLIHLYSVGYMAGENSIKRYFAMLGFFTFAMLGIVVSDNLLVLFIFWELVGFSSFMLVGHWLQKSEAARAAKKAFLFNRIGDAGFLIGIMIIWSNTQNLNLSSLLQFNEIAGWQTAASLFIFCGVIGKSAQFPLFTWLPDAMEGPTPVSALIHAATMVAAGVFLLARVFTLFTPSALNVVAVTGVLTGLLAAWSALHQFDIKKILAYSTVSQLGLMVAAIGAGSESAAFIHLFSHAFFKACLFLGAGSIIHAVHQAQHQSKNDFDVQDIRNLGGLRKKLPFTFLIFLIAGSSLAGVPLFSGFLSKDSILTSIWIWTGAGLSWKWFVLLSAFTVSFLTMLYTFRMIWYIFFSRDEHELSITDAPIVMRIPMAMLALGSCWLLISFNPFSTSGWLTHIVGSTPHIITTTLLSVIIVSLGFATGWYLYVLKKNIIQAKPLFQNGYGMDVFYKRTIEQSTLKLATISETIDRKWIDGFLHFTAYAHVSIAHLTAWFDKNIVDGSVNAWAWLAGLLGSFTRSFQGGKIQLYILWGVVGLIIFLFFLLI